MTTSRNAKCLAIIVNIFGDRSLDYAVQALKGISLFERQHYCSNFVV